MCITLIFFDVRNGLKALLVIVLLKVWVGYFHCLSRKEVRDNVGLFRMQLLHSIDIHIYFNGDFLSLSLRNVFTPLYSCFAVVITGLMSTPESC